MAKKEEIKKEDSEKVRIFSKRLGDVICPDGTIMVPQKAVLVSKETAEWLLKSFGSLMMKID